MKKALAGCGFAALLLMSACTPAQSPQAVGEVHHPQAKAGVNAAELGYGLLGPGPINYGAHRLDSYRYSSQGNYTGNSFHTPSPSRNDLGDDTELIQNIVAREDGFNPGMVIIAGSHAWVNVKMDNEVSAEEKTKKVKQLEQKIQDQVPRFQIHVNEPS